jgi:hypothetical protein
MSHTNLILWTGISATLTAIFNWQTYKCMDNAFNPPEVINSTITIQDNCCSPDQSCPCTYTRPIPQPPKPLTRDETYCKVMYGLAIGFEALTVSLISYGAALWIYSSLNPDSVRMVSRVLPEDAAQAPEMPNDLRNIDAEALEEAPESQSPIRTVAHQFAAGVMIEVAESFKERVIESLGEMIAEGIN